MFNNLIKLSTGRTTTKILATLLVMTLTFANVALLGTFMFNSIAVDSVLPEQDNSTNSANVKFDAYFDLTNTKLKEVTKDINAEDLVLHVAVSVEGNGRFEKGIIDFSESSFKSKENEELLKTEIDTIYAGNKIVIDLPILFREDSNLKLSLLNMISKIKLTGQYIDENGNITDIDTAKEVKVNWTTNEIAKEEVEISQEVITNRIYEINGANKRVLQLLVKTNLKDNKAPIESTKLEIDNPIKDVIPEKVEVTTFSTLATNGKGSVAFNNQQESSWEYKAEENKTYIELTNKANSDGIISWNKDAKDELIITYIYDEKTEIKSIISNIKAILKVYKNDTTLEKENSVLLENIEEKGNLINLKASIEENIYKGNMYLSENTEYKTKYEVLVSYCNGNSIYIVDSGDKIDSENLNAYYKKTIISREEAVNVLGKEGTIKIYDAVKNELISEISLEQEIDSLYYTVEYATDVNNIIIETSAPVKAGKINIENEKIIKVLLTEKIEELTKIDTETILTVKDLEGNEIEKIIEAKIANLLEPKTSINLLLNKKVISNQAENDLTMIAVINTINSSNKLLENPTINIELPEEITEVTLVDAINLLYEDELKIKSSEIIVNENGKKVISIQLEGKQKKYDASANIVMNLKVKANPFMADKEVEIKTTCVSNNVEEANVVNKIKISSKKGIITKNSIVIGENKVEDINNNELKATISKQEEIQIKSLIINNNGQKMANTILTGIIPEGTNLKSALKTNLDNASIYYANKENPEKDEWITEVEDYSKIKEFKIEIGEVEQAKEFGIEYILVPTEDGLKEKELFENELSLNYAIEEKAKQEKIEFKVMNFMKEKFMEAKQNNNLIMSIKPKTNTQAFHEGQIVTYELAITNVGKEPLNNINLNYAIPEGAVYTEFTYAQADTVTFEDNVELKNKEWNIEVLQPNETITKEVLIKIKNGTEQIINKAELKDDKGIVLLEIVTEPKKVIKSDISVRMSRKDNYVIDIEEGDIIEYNVIVENLSDKEINNLKVKVKIPENTTFLDDNEGWTYNKEENMIYSNIEPIKPKSEEERNNGHIALLVFKVRVNKFDTNITSSTIESSAIIEDSNSNEYETNIYKCKVKTIRWEIDQKAEHNQTLKEGETVKYIIEAKNVGEREAYANVKDSVPQEIQLQKVKIYIDETLIEEKDIFSSNEIDVNFKLSVGQILRIEIEGIVYDLEEGIDQKEIKNVAQLNLWDGNYLNSQEIVNLIVKDKKESDDPENPDNPTKPENPDKPTDPDDPSKPEDPDKPTDPDNLEKHSISGLAWIDKNKNGIKDNNESILQGVEVILLNQKGEIVKDSDGNKVTTVTTINGIYKFNNIKEGNYIVIFIYDTNKYAVTKYKVSNVAETENSDVIEKEITLEGKNIAVAATDIIKLKNADITNIDVGLIEKEKFDVSLDKYIEKVILTNSQESTTYNYSEASLAKIEIDAKKLAQSSILVQYKIKVSNNGEVNAYIKDVIDYIPNELTFNSEMNPDWYLDSQGKLHNQTLEKVEIKPDESKTVSLVLTKVLNNNSTGSIENLAEIGDVSNVEGMQEFDSVAGNKKLGEDDISSASLIISIKTGSPILYIGIVISTLLILSTGIYLINKKVLKGGI